MSYTAASSPAPFSPNTQALIRDFVGLPTPVFEATDGFQESDGQAGDSAYIDMTIDAMSMSTRPSVSSNCPDATALDFYQCPGSKFLPTGFSLWDMSGFIHQSANWEDFQAKAPSDLGPPFQASQLFTAWPPADPVMPNKQAPEAAVVPSLSEGSDTSLETDPTRCLFLPPPSSMKGTKTIDVPPFLREKLVQSYCYNAKRFPSIHFDRLKFRDRLLLGLNSELHPAFVFSSVCMHLRGVASSDSAH